MQLILVRHGRPYRVAHQAGGADPELTGEGIEQADRLAGELATGRWGPVTGVVSSTMLRARQTAAPIAARLGVALSTADERLVELDHGWAHYGTISASATTSGERLAALNAGRWGDDQFDPDRFRDRVVAGVEHQVATHPEGAVVVVCHGGVINAYLTHVLGLPQVMFCFPRYTSVSRVLANGAEREILSINEAPHLPRPNSDVPGAPG